MAGIQYLAEINPGYREFLSGRLATEGRPMNFKITNIVSSGGQNNGSTYFSGPLPTVMWFVGHSGPRGLRSNILMSTHVSDYLCAHMGRFPQDRNFGCFVSLF